MNSTARRKINYEHQPAENTLRNFALILTAIVFLAFVVRSVFTGRLPVRRNVILRSQTPLLFYAMCGLYIFFAVVVGILLSGHLMTLINLTI